jgi:hypothetical protein
MLDGANNLIPLVVKGLYPSVKPTGNFCLVFKDMGCFSFDAS